MIWTYTKLGSCTIILSEVDFASESNGTPMGERRKSRTAGKRVMNAVLGDVKTHAC